MSPRMATRRPRDTRPMPSSGASPAKTSKRGRHRRRIGVVALVDQRDRAVEPARPEQHRPARAAPLRRPPVAERERRRARSPPSASTAASAPSAFIAKCRPGAPSLKRNGRPCARAATRGAGPASTSSRRAGLRPSARCRSAPAAPRRAAPPRQDRVGRRCRGQDRRAARLQPLEDRRLLARDASTSRKAARCAAATVVIIATCGRASRASGAISPGAFMPISIDGEIAVARQPRQRQRHAPVVVVARLGGVHPALRRRAPRAASPWCRSCRPSP